jgi:hypothetical protein
MSFPLSLTDTLFGESGSSTNNKAYVRCSRRLRSGARKATGLRRRGTGRSRPAATRAAHHFKRVGAAGPNCPREAMLRDLLLPCDWEDKGPYLSPYLHRPGAGQSTLGRGTAPALAVPGPVRGSASGHWAGARLSRPNRSGLRSSSVVALYLIAAMTTRQGLKVRAQLDQGY